MVGWTRRSATCTLLAATFFPLSTRAKTFTPSPPLWIASGAVGSAVLFGQMPVRHDTVWETPQIMSAFEAGSALWVENPVFSRAEVEMLVEQAAGKQRPTTAEFLPEADLNRLHAQLAQAGAPRDAFDQTPADDVFQQLSAMADAKSGADFTRLPERIFREKAVAAAKPIVTEWQSLAEVANFIPPAPDPIQLQLIRLGLDDVDQANQSAAHLQAWMSGDIMHFERLGAVIAHRYPALTAKMSGERNRRLAERLAAAMQSSGQHFVCVGIRHLTGPESVQSYLADLGLSVQRLA